MALLIRPKSGLSEARVQIEDHENTLIPSLKMVARQAPIKNASRGPELTMCRVAVLEDDDSGGWKSFLSSIVFCSTVDPH